MDKIATIIFKNDYNFDIIDKIFIEDTTIKKSPGSPGLPSLFV